MRKHKSAHITELRVEDKLGAVDSWREKTHHGHFGFGLLEVFPSRTLVT